MIWAKDIAAGVGLLAFVACSFALATVAVGAGLTFRDYGLGWDDYTHAYEEMIRHTATPECPWYVIPADHKWFTRLAVAAVVNEALESPPLHFPKIPASHEADLAKARKSLLAEK